MSVKFLCSSNGRFSIPKKEQDHLPVSCSNIAYQYNTVLQGKPSDSVAAWALESRNSGIPLTIGIQFPSSTDKDWNPVPGIRDPWRGIQDPRLFLGFLTCGETLHENESNKV